jgi:UDP-glucuronate 4-epimerase
LQAGYTVVGLDNLNDYYAPSRKRENLREIHDQVDSSSTFDFNVGDIRDRQLVESLFESHEISAIVHLAAMAGVRTSVEAPALYVDVNVQGTLNLLDAAQRHSVPRFVAASTSSVYGSTTRVPFVEDDPCDRPLAPYAATKRSAEMLAHVYHHVYGQSVAVLRFFTVYGERGRPDMMPFKLANSLLTGETIPLYNDGNLFRDWTHVSDVVEGVFAATQRPLGYEIFNIGRGEPVLVSDFIRVLEDVSNLQVRAVSTPAPATENGTRVCFSSLSVFCSSSSSSSCCPCCSLLSAASLSLLPMSRSM